MKKLFSIILTLVLILSVVPMGAFTITARAESNGEYEYTISGGITITKYIGEETDVVIPEEIDGKTVSSIGKNAFKNSGITSLIMPDTITSIGESAFNNCTSLASVKLSNKLTSIGSSAFWYTAIENIDIPKSLTTTADSGYSEYVGPFAHCDYLTTATFEESIKTIPTNIFKGSNIESIIIPDTVTTIGQSAFEGCANLNDVTIGNSVKTIENDSFKNCKSLEAIIIPDSVTSIGVNAFYNCTSLASVKLSNKLTSIGSSAFWYTAIESIDIPKTLTTTADSGYSEYAGPFAHCDYLITATFENGIKTIPANIFRGSNIESIIIPDTVTTIGQSAFEGCAYLNDVTIGNSVKTIENDSFKNCKTLEAIIIPDSVTSIGVNAFYNCTSLSSVKLSNKLTSIASGAFWYTAIENIDIPKSLTTTADSGYSEYAGPFAHCDYLTTATFEDGIKTIPANIFRGSNIESIVIPNTVIEIGSYAFDSCKNLNSITLGNSIKTIGDSAFGYTAIEEIVLPESVITINSKAFYGCTSLTNITVPDSVTSIGESAFNNCTSLASVKLSNKLTSIGSSAFWYTAIENINIPKSLTTTADSGYSEYAGPFAHCDYLTTATFEDGIKTIPANIFRGSNIESIIIPDTVTTIGQSAFEGCANLQDVTIGNSVITIANDSFKNCKSLEAIIIPDSVTSIGVNAFYNCTSLASVKLSNKLTSIASGAFWYTAIESIEIPKSLSATSNSGYPEYVGPFAHCDYLTTVSFENGTVTIPENVLSGCTNLEEVFIPDTVSVIGKNAFSSTAITDVWYGGTEEDKAKITINSGNDVLATAIWHYNSCNVNLEHAYDNACDTNCNNCDKLREVPDHIYDNNDDLICNECGYERPPYAYGDVNEDGKINNKDVGILLQYINTWPVTINTFTADVNVDGKVNNKDIGILLQYINNWDVILGK